MVSAQGRRQKLLKGFSNQNNTLYDDSIQYCACTIACIPCMLQVSGDNSKRERKGKICRHIHGILDAIERIQCGDVFRIVGGYS